MAPNRRGREPANWAPSARPGRGEDGAPDRYFPIRSRERDEEPRRQHPWNLGSQSLEALALSGAERHIRYSASREGAGRDLPGNWDAWPSPAKEAATPGNAGA